MKEQYFKVHKDVAARAGLSDKLREVVDEDFLFLSEKDIRMISLTLEERVHALGICPLCEQENDELRTDDDSSSPENEEQPIEVDDDSDNDNNDEGDVENDSHNDDDNDNDLVEEEENGND